MFTQPAPAPADAMPVFTQPAAALTVDGLKPTDEQAAIIDTYQSGGDLVIEAGAGTGKTSTLRMLGAAQPGNRCLYVAFNTAIAGEAKGTFPPNVACSTAHSLAYRAVGHRYQGRLNGARLPAREVARHLGIPPVVDVGQVALTAGKVARIVADTVRGFCYSADIQPEPKHVPYLPGLGDPVTRAALQTAVTPLAAKAWQDLTSLTGVLRFEHDHYLKIWALTRPRLPADVVFVDEAQDLNPVIAHVVADQTDAQRVLVGDPSQAIYGWRGAVDAMSGMAGPRLALSQSWRFGSAIADEANKWLDLLDAPLRLTGNPGITSTIGRADHPDVVLCRTNAGAIDQAIQAIGRGDWTAVVGDGRDVRRLAEAAAQLHAGQRCDHPELVAFNTWREVQEYVDNDAAGADLKTLVKLVDTYGPDTIIRVCDQLVPENKADTVISTAHKAKGREWACVRVHDDFIEPAPDDPDDPYGAAVPATEAMLAYVTVTRARQHLDRAGLAWVDRWASYTPTPKEETAMPQIPSEAAPAPPPSRVDLPPDASNWAEAYREAERNEKAWADIKARAREQLEHLMGDAEEGRINGVLAVRWSYVTSKRLDTKKLREQAPDLVDQFMIENVTRRFTIQ